MAFNNTLAQLLELANRYPSPHNGQPIRLRQLGPDNFEIFFDKERGLQATKISFIFSFVSIGVFVEHLKMAAQALGHSIVVKTALPHPDELRSKGLLHVADCQVAWSSTEPDAALQTILSERQTSRKKYTEAPDERTAAELLACASEQGMQLHKLDRQHTRQAIWLNQRAVFDDMFEEPVRKELDHWLRYSADEKETKRDGLAYDCMEMSGSVMKAVTRHPGILRAPVMSTILEQYYLRTMTDNSEVYYLLAPFETAEDAFLVGETIMRLWLIIARHGYYLHPFGTIMSNQAAHQDFLKLAGITDESRQQKYLVFIFRAGKSDKPHQSLRKPVDEHLMIGAET